MFTKKIDTEAFMFAAPFRAGPDIWIWVKNVAENIDENNHVCAVL
jgi:hypothetical protein